VCRLLGYIASNQYKL
jgi:hypothetical protein